MNKIVLFLAVATALTTGSRASCEPDAVVRITPASLDAKGHLVGPRTVVTRTPTVGMSAEEAEIARLSALPPITVSMRDVSVGDVLTEVAGRASMNLAPADLPDRISLSLSGTPWEILQGMEKADWLNLNYVAGFWHARSAQVPEAKTYILRHIGAEWGANAEPAVVADVRKIVGMFGPQVGESGTQVVYNPESNAVFVVARRSAQRAVVGFLAQVDQPKTQSSYSVSIAGELRRPAVTAVDGAEVFISKLDRIAIPEEVAAEDTITRKWTIRYVDVGTTIRLQRVGPSTHYRISSSRVVGQKVSKGIIEPAIATQEVEGVFSGDQAVVILGETKTTVTKKFLFLHWNTSKTLPAAEVSISRSDILVGQNSGFLPAIPVVGFAFKR